VKKDPAVVPTGVLDSWLLFSSGYSEPLNSSYVVKDHLKPIWSALTLAELFNQVKQL